MHLEEEGPAVAQRGAHPRTRAVQARGGHPYESLHQSVTRPHDENTSSVAQPTTPPTSTIKQHSKALQAFRDRCLRHWLKGSGAGAKNMDLDHLKDFIESQLSQSEQNRDLSIHKVYQKKSHETIDIEKRLLRGQLTQEQVDAKVTSQERH